MKIMVSGGAGFIGSWIVDMLIERGYSVVVVDNLSTGKKANIHPQAVFYEMDILNPEINKVIAQELPEVIIHHGALVYVQQSIKDPLADGMVNAMGTLNLLNAAKEYKVRKFIYASTCAVYGEPEVEMIAEDHGLNPLSFYGGSKLMGEMYVRLFSGIFNLDYTILRYANVYGPRQGFSGEGGVIPIFLQKMKDNMAPTIFGDGNQTRDFVYVADVARANLLVLDKGSRETFNIGSGVGTSVNQLYTKIAQIMAFSEGPRYELEKVGDVKHVTLDPAKAHNQLSWEPQYPLFEGLEETIRFYYD